MTGTPSHVPGPQRLDELLSPSAIRLGEAAGDWRSAIRAAGSLLEADGIASAAYTDSMIESVERNGPYIVIAPGFAFAHARPDETVARTGMSLVRLESPVEFGHSSNDPVTLVLALAAVDSDAHRAALAQLAKVLASPQKRAALDAAQTPEAVLDVLRPAETQAAPQSPAPVAAAPVAGAAETAAPAADPVAGAAESPLAAETGDDLADCVASKGLILTVCGNGLGTSLFLKNTLEQVLTGWGWAGLMTVEATDTISAKGKAKSADCVLTSGGIADALGDLGVPVEVIDDFTSQREIDSALRRLYAV